MRHIVGRRGRQQRAGCAEKQVIGTFDVHDIGMFGDRPERPIRAPVDQRHRRVGAQVGHRCVQPRLVGVGGRVGEDLRRFIDDRRAHCAPHLAVCGF
jgi:hypothetical protein